MRVRTPLLIPLLAASLACAATTTVAGAAASAATTTSPAGATRTVGHWRVVPLAGGGYRVTWTSPTVLPLTDARPVVYVGGHPAGPVTLTPRSVSAVVHAPTAPSPGALDVRLSGHSLDRPSAPSHAAPATPYTLPQRVRPSFPDPGRKGDHAIVSSEYTLPAVKIVGMPEKVEMVGHVVRPKDPDPSDPLVLFLHGRHSVCYVPQGRPAPSAIARSEAMGARTDGGLPIWQCPAGEQPIPSYQGYEYAQRLLASQGYVTVSISADAINALDYTDADGGAASRAALIRRHLADWVTWVADGTYQANMDDVFLVGHSRGGEGVARASITIPESAPYHISGQLLIAPTDFARQAPAYIPTVTLLGYCDGDVSDLEGQIFTDYARTDLVADDTALHSSVLFMGADHNFFNTEWTPGQSQAPSNDDWGGPPTAPCGTDDPARLTAKEQQRAAKTYIAGAVQMIASGRHSLLPMFDGSAVSVPSAGRADVRTETIGAGRDLRRPGIDASLGGSQAATTQICLGTTGTSIDCGYQMSYGQTPHWLNFGGAVYYQSAFQMSWTKAGGYGGVTFATPMDLSAATSLDLRTAVDPTVGDIKVDVRLHDANGDTATVTPDNNGVVPALEVGSPPLSKRWAQTLRVPLQGVSGVDLSQITGVDLIARSTTGKLWVLDLAGVHAGLPTPPDTRLAVMNMRNSTVKRHGTGSFTAHVPYRIRNDLTHDAVVTVEPSQYSAPFNLTIPAGTQKGTFPITIPSGSGGATVQFVVYAVHDVMTGNYIGNLTVQASARH